MSAKGAGVFILTILLAAAAASGGTGRQDSPVSVRHHKWLEEDVAYIITPKEKEVFLQLGSDRERDVFIEAFWKHRDPRPETPENEFREEHYDRIAYANKFLGRASPTAGWRTDRGRMHIILGEPNAVDRFDNLSEVYPTIIWTYQGMARYGLPDSFTLVFLKKYGAGDYELYSPIKDGPQNILVHFHGDPSDYLAAFEQLNMVHPELARASVSLLFGEEGAFGFRPSIASEILISNIEIKPQKAVRDEYAEKLLRYKDVVEVEYSANYIASDALVCLMRDGEGRAFVHYLIEPERLSVLNVEGNFQTTLEISGRVTDPDGASVYQFNRRLPIRFDSNQLERIGTSPFSYRDAFPLVPGKFHFSLLVKNFASKEFASLEREILVPDRSGPAAMTRLVLGHRMDRVEPSREIKPFQAEGIQFFPTSRREFTRGDDLTVFFQLTGLTTGNGDGSMIRYRILREENVVLRRDRPLPDGRYPGFFESFGLKDLPPAHYTLEVSLIDSAGREILGDDAYFSVSQAEYIPRPFISTRPLPSPAAPVWEYIRGGQWYNQGKIGKARKHLESAWKAEPDGLPFAIGYARLLFREGDYSGARDVLLPFASRSGAEGDPGILKLLGDSCRNLERLAEAIEYYRAYLETHGTNLEVLNSLGECHALLDDPEEARRIWTRSLEIQPDQPRVRRLLEVLKKRSFS